MCQKSCYISSGGGGVRYCFKGISLFSQSCQNWAAARLLLDFNYFSFCGFKRKGVATQQTIEVEEVVTKIGV